MQTDRGNTITKNLNFLCLDKEKPEQEKEKAKKNKTKVNNGVIQSTQAFQSIFCGDCILPTFTFKLENGIMVRVLKDRLSIKIWFGECVKAE